MGECTLLFNDQIPNIFCTIEFYHLKPQTTPVKQGLSVDFGFSGKFRVDVDDSFLEYLSSGHVIIELRQVIMGAQHKLIGIGKILLSQFLNEKMEFGGIIEFKSTKEQKSIGGIKFKIKIQGTIIIYYTVVGH